MHNLVVIVMPTKACNLACRYCYVTEKPQSYMSKAMAEKVLANIFECVSPSSMTKIIWHGGEPLLAGLNFYRHVMAVQKAKYREYRIQNCVQTNGTLLSDEWIDFFLQESFGVGVSLDGPKTLHDANRRYTDGRTTFDRVLSNLQRARARGLEVGALAVITRYTIDREEELFQFFKELQVHITLNPVTIMSAKVESEIGLTPAQFASIAVRLFDLWLYQDEPVIDVKFLHHVVNAILAGGNSRYCVFSPSCARGIIAIDPQGTVYSCDRFVGTPEMALGSLTTMRLRDILRSTKRQRLLEPRDKQITHCRNCRWADYCHGGCPHRAYTRYGTLVEPDFFCEAFQAIFEYASQRIRLELDQARFRAKEKAISFHHDSSELMMYDAV
jgi:uncharacterized protein